MKTAIYIEDGVTQLVITPETDFEKNTLRMLGDGDVNAKMHTGSFYDCRGGWVRQSRYNSHMNDLSGDKGDQSLILNVSTAEEINAKENDG